MYTAVKAILADADMKLVGFGPRGHENGERGREKERKRESETERQSSEEWDSSLTLARGNVAVFPVGPVFIICDVAPRLHVPVRIPAEATVSQFHISQRRPFHVFDMVA